MWTGCIYTIGVWTLFSGTYDRGDYLGDWRGNERREAGVYIVWMKNYMHYDDMSTKRFRSGLL